MASNLDDSRERAFRITLALGVAALVLLRVREGTGNLLDDAYMTLRHSRNFALGHGLVYNAGVPCLGTTTPLFALSCGLLGKVAGPERVLEAAVAIGATCDAFAFVLIARWVAAAARSRAVGIGAAVYYAFAPRALEYSTGGMESPLFTLLIIITLHEATMGRETRAGVSAGLALVCRLDGGLAAIVAGAALAIDRRRVPWRFLAALALTALPWIAYAFAVYPHGPIPQSVIAKAHRPFFVEPDQAARAIARELAAAGFGRFAWIAGGKLGVEPRAWLVLVGAIATVALLIVGARRLDARGRREGSVALTFAFAYAALYAIGNPLMLGWYQVPLEAFTGILLVPGLVELARLLERRTGTRALARIVVVGLILGQVTAALGLRHELALNYALGECWRKTRERDTLACAERLRERARPDAVVQASENGAIGWGWPGTCLDTVGLQTPGAEDFYPLARAPRSGNMAVPVELVLHFAPDYFVSLEVFVRDTCLRDPRFEAAYVLDEELSDLAASTYRSKGLLVFRRR